MLTSLGTIEHYKTYIYNGQSHNTGHHNHDGSKQYRNCIQKKYILIFQSVVMHQGFCLAWWKIQIMATVTTLIFDVQVPQHCSNSCRFCVPFRVYVIHKFLQQQPN